MSECVDPAAGERCADCPAAPGAEPVPVLGPYLGVVGAVLCVLIGGFLLLAPYAFDYRDGAAAAPRSTVVDLATGAAVAALGLLTAASFGAALARRLRGWAPAVEYDGDPYPDAVAQGTGEDPQHGDGHDPRPSPESESESGSGSDAGTRTTTEPAAEPQPLAPAAATADPGGALRDLLTPLVAALAADLRARESAGETEGKRL